MPSKSKTRAITPQAAADFQVRFRAAPVLKLNEGEEVRYLVARVGVVPSDADREPFFETTDHKLYRLPDELGSWAYDLVAASLASATNIFPTPFNFGRHASGRYWVEIE